MDDLTLMQSFRAERAETDREAREEIWRALEARLDSADAIPAPVATPRRRPKLLPRRRRLLAFAGATAVAAVAAGVLVLGSGPTAQSAAAAILHETAVIAASPDGPATSPLPGPGQFSYRKFKRLELVSWVPAGLAGDDGPLQSGGGLLTGPDAAKAFTALQPTTQQWWTGLDGAGRVREVAGTPRFLTSEERRRWEAAGSPLPAPFDPEYQREYPLAYGDALEAGRGVVDTEHAQMKGFRFPDTSSLPTDPLALRLAVEGNRISVSGFNLMEPAAKQLDSEATIAELFNILAEGNPMTPQLRAAIFNALAELPGIEVDTDATDFLGRHGNAIRSIDPQTGSGSEFVFDPDTSELLAERSFLGDAQRQARQNPTLKGLPTGLTIRETAYLESGVVDSTRETADGGGE
jgi:hypothetical protein